MKELRNKLATMLKIHCVTDVFLGTCPKFTESYFNELFSRYAKQKPVKYSLSGVLFNPIMLVVTKGHTYLNKPGSPT